MLSISGTSFGSLGNFQAQEIPAPEPRDGEVRIRIDATALGFVDGLLVEGRYQLRPPLPYIPGGEIAGVVDMVGAGVTNVSLGDRVATWQLGGGLAEYVVVPSKEVDVLPVELESRFAAAMVVDFQTAHYALFERAALEPGETVLILGAGGAVASAAIQLAARAGANVIAAASTVAKREFARQLGAQNVIDYTVEDWRDGLRTDVPRGGIDVVFDTVGGASFDQAFRSLRKGGRYLVLGFAAGSIPVLSINLALIKSAQLIGVDIRHFIATDPDRASRVRRSLYAAVAAGRLLPPRTVEYPLSQAISALAATTSREKAGKIVVIPDRVGAVAK